MKTHSLLVWVGQVKSGARFNVVNFPIRTVIFARHSRLKLFLQVRPVFLNAAPYQGQGIGGLIGPSLIQCPPNTASNVFFDLI
jgi:hypothetical protein